MSEGCPSELRNSQAHAFVSSLDVPQLDDIDAHHLGRVLRLRDGAEISVSDGLGRWRLARYSKVGLEPTGEVHTMPSPSVLVHMCFAPTKGDRPDWAVQKLTELGVASIRPLTCARSIVRWDSDKASKQLERWERIAREAAMQSRRTTLPIIEPVTRSIDLARSGHMLRTDIGGSTIGALDWQSLGELTLLVGPEGGWSDEECERWPDSVSFGYTVLRTETAAVALASAAIALGSG